MSWLRLEMRLTPDSLPAVEQSLMNCGAISITLLSDADEPVLEPGPGEVPLWSGLRLQALFALDTDMARLRRALDGLGASVNDLRVDFVQPDEWQEAARNCSVERVFGDRLWLVPKNTSKQQPPVDRRNKERSMVQLRLDPGLAFGSGSHPTTSMCLDWLALNVEPGQRVLDFGCGSGILGIAAALLGAQVVAVDYDPQAITATRDNATHNGVDQASLQLMTLRSWQADLPVRCFDAVVANILAGPLQSLAEQFEQAVIPGGSIVLSGVLSEQTEEVMAAYTGTAFTSPRLEAGWACLHGTMG